MSDDEQNDELLALTAQIVTAHVARNPVEPEGLSVLIREVYATLGGLGREVQPAPEPKEPAVPIKRSVFPDHIVCLEDGKKLKMLKRHLMTAYGMTVDQYREKWGLPPSYPMVAPNYAQHRSTLARKIGLGRKPGGAAAPDATEEALETAAADEADASGPAPRRRGRKPSAD